MANYISLHVRVIWQDIHWRLVGVEETDDGESTTEFIIGGVTSANGFEGTREDVGDVLSEVGRTILRQYDPKRP